MPNAITARYYMSKASHIHFRRAAPFYGSVATSGLSVLAAGIIIMALPWSYLSNGGSPAWAGVLAAALHLPIAIGYAVGGRAADRVGPRAVLIATNAGSAAAVFSATAVAILMPQAIVPVVGLLALANLAGAPGSVAQDSRIPELARLARLPLERANGLREIVSQMGQVGGPALGVVLVEVWGLFDALLVAASVLLTVCIIDSALFPAFKARRITSEARAAQGVFHALLGDPFLRATIPIGLVLVAVFNALDEVLAPNLALKSEGSGQDLALFLALTGASALASTALYTAFGRKLEGRMLFVAGVLLLALGLLLLAALPPSIAFLAAPAFLGAGVGPLWPIMLTDIHKKVPAGARGEIIGVLVGLLLLAQPAAALVAGPAVSLIGVELLTIVLALATALLAMVAPFLSGLKPRSNSEGIKLLMTYASSILVVIATVALLSAPDRTAKAEPPPPRARPVIAMTVSPERQADARIVAGVVRASERSDLSFRVSGKVSEVTVDIGARVAAGQVLARLDTSIMRLRLKQARAALERTEAERSERARRLEVQQRLKASGHTTLQALRTAELEVATSEAEVRDARAQLALAERDLADTTLVAPHSGVIAAREVEPNTELNDGQVVLRLDGTEALEVSANVPASIIERAQPGKAVTIEVPAIGRVVKGQISRVGERSDEGLTFPALAALDEGSRGEGVRPGMVANITFHGEANGGIIIPLSALVAGPSGNSGSVFVIDQAHLVARRREVAIKKLTDTGALISGGLNAGETIVAVGAAFINDGDLIQPIERK